ncbi:ParB-like partition protein [Mycobacterium phage Vincenzo]|uniref:DNA methylase n=2 Tax=Coopervirus vincenzo TaxID=1983110 RepID=A0A0F6WDY6_9CAUD|nr:ParB-like partition protein [Mycobacterium phage Vincenzo]AKF14263.1 hypothetical protein SEA_VINCENZO_1 [Mycobacterium phage Vincenzo]AKF14666.1 hypothetical protein SEA_ALANGRANT_1 [Mycobacterium phage AlanGrant]
MASTVGKTTSVSPSQLHLFHKNARRGDVPAIMASLRRHTQYTPITVNVGTHTGRPNEVLKGNHTLMAFRELAETDPFDKQWQKIAVFWVDVDDDLAERIVVADNQIGRLGGFDDAQLAELVSGFDGDLDGLGFTDADVEALLGLNDEPGGDGDPSGDGGGAAPSIPLADRYGVPPFSVLDRRGGVWQERKREWLSAGLGLDNHDGREETLLLKIDPQGSDIFSTAVQASGGSTSVFDPVLCEVAYRWHTPEIDTPVSVLDPFAGGPVRGLLAGAMGLHYTGIDVRAEQIAANHAALGRRPEYADRVTWLHGDATRMGEVLADDQAFDLVFSCPPYGDLECYNDDNDRDISAWDYEDFLVGHAQAITDAAARLRDDRFAVWVTSDIRDKSGYYRGLVSATNDAFAAAGLRLLNEAVIVDPVGSTRLRTARPFEAGRKIARMHQYMLIYVKGDVRAATEWAKQGREFVVPDDDNDDIADAV